MKSFASNTKTLASRQKLAVVIIALCIVALAIAFFGVRYLVSIDTWEDLDGTQYTVKRQDGVYMLFDDIGPLETFVDDDVTLYQTALGTLVTVSDNGAVDIHTVVDTQGIESVSDSNLLMIYKRIQVEDIQSVRITNDSGTYVFERNEDEDIVIRNYESVAYDQELVAYLYSVCGNTTVMTKLSSEALEKYGYEEYGLDDPAAKLTVNTKDGERYVLHVGNPIVSGAGYYVRREGFDAVYIFNTTIGQTSLVSLEQYVTPILTYPLSVTTYPMVYNFTISTFTYAADGTPTMEPDIAVTFWPLEDRINTEYQSQLYKMLDPDLQSYTPSSEAVYSTMEKFLEMEYVGVKKLGVTAEALAEYGLDKPAKMLYYEFHDVDENGDPFYVKHYISISAMTEVGTYYVTSSVQGSSDNETFYPLPAYDHIVEVDRAMLPFMTWDPVKWVEPGYFQLYIATCDTLQMTSPDYDLTFEVVPDKYNSEGEVEDVKAYLDSQSGKKELDINNFKTLLMNMVGGRLFGKTHITDEEKAAIIADPDRHLLTFTVTYNSGNTKTCSFYWLSDGRALLTVNGKGEFYVLSSAVEKIRQDAIDVANGIRITAVSPYVDLFD